MVIYEGGVCGGICRSRVSLESLIPVIHERPWKGPSGVSARRGKEDAGWATAGWFPPSGAGAQRQSMFSVPGVPYCGNSSVP